jgi:hypothetical protein
MAHFAPPPLGPPLCRWEVHYKVYNERSIRTTEVKSSRWKCCILLKFCCIFSCEKLYTYVISTPEWRPKEHIIL